MRAQDVQRARTTMERLVARSVRMKMAISGLLVAAYRPRRGA
ncbi:hypothetical protein BPPAE11_00190 [Pseudomonas phage YMC/01/01/P52_PAE_BP]|nr:hypothetical protein BPPAE11_00190 [Pseudomonas phage YMC/01/01/P52_PAE_BP]